MTDNRKHINGDFRKLIEGNYAYVDKTGFINEVMNHHVIIYSRPDGFGKSLNMSMLYYFFSNQEESHELFKNLNIAKDEKAMKHLNQYPVINISLKNVGGTNFKEAIDNFRSELEYFIISNNYLLENGDEYDRQSLIGYINKESDSLSLESSIKNLTRIMHKYFNKEVIVLIDDYDTPLHFAYRYGYFNEMSQFLMSLFGSTLKTNFNLHMGVLSGCIRIVKDLISESFNNFEMDTVLGNCGKPYFGYTENEVKCLFNEFNLSDKVPIIKEWCDGYLFEDDKVYNPWLITKCISIFLNNSEKKSEIFRVDPSKAIVVGDCLKRHYALRRDIERLLEGETVIKYINDHLRYEQLYDDYDIYYLLISTGYLNAQINNWEKHEYRLTIPNKYIRTIFEECFSRYDFS